MTPESTAPAATEEQATSTPEVTTGQAEPSVDESNTSFTDVDPSSLPPELQDLWNKTYKSLQGDYTKKTQEISESRQKAELYDQLMASGLVPKNEEPVETQPEVPALSGEELLTKILQDPNELQRMIQEEAKKLVDPLYEEKYASQAEQTYNNFLKDHPDLAEHEEVMTPLVQKGYSLEDAYRVATYDKVMQRGIDKGAEKVMQRDKTAQPGSVPAPVQPNIRATTTREAFKQAQEQLGWNG